MKKEPITDIIYNGSRAEIGHAAGTKRPPLTQLLRIRRERRSWGTIFYSFQLMFGEDLLKVPMTCDELISMGWQAESPEDLETVVEANSYVMGVTFIKGNNEISADILNLGINAAPAGECPGGQYRYRRYRRCL